MAEFFRVRTVEEALHGFRPARRTGIERVRLPDAAGRVAATDVAAPGALPGFARSSVDGFAVRAVDTFGASEGLPAYLTLLGSVAMGASAAVDVTPGGAVAVPTGGALPAGCDAVVMVEHTAQPLADTVEVLRPAAAGDGVVLADDDVRAGASVLTSGTVLRAEHLGLLAALGITEVDVIRRPVVAVLSTGDEVVPPETATLAVGQVRDATATAIGALIRSAGGTDDQRGIVADDATSLRSALADALAECDVVVVSAGSSVGARDLTAEVVGSLGAPGVWCHGLAVKPGKPTLLADCGGVPVVGLPGNPLSALVIFRLIGVPMVRLVGGRPTDVTTATVAATLSRDVPSAAGRLDVVQVRLTHGVAEPLFGKSAQLSLLTSADGEIIVPSEAAGLFAGDAVQVRLHG